MQHIIIICDTDSEHEFELKKLIVLDTWKKQLYKVHNYAHNAMF